MLKHLVKKELEQVNVLLTKEEKQRLVAQAKRYTGGNITAWIKYCSRLKPNPKDLMND